MKNYKYSSFANLGSDKFSYSMIREELPLPSVPYYFAFGSNMSRKRMQKRGLIWSHIFKAHLKNYSLDFSKKSFYHGVGYANISPKNDSIVHGVLYKLETKKDALILDEFECSPEHYKRVELTVQTENKTVTAFTYIATKNMTGENLNPSTEYLAHLLDGHLYLPKKYHHWLSQTKTGCDKQELPVFVYGTLKSGFGNHKFYCGNAEKVENAEIDGELFASGLPYLHINKKNIYSYGSANYEMDNQDQDDLIDFLKYGGSQTQLKSNTVKGELITFDEWSYLHDLDSLEGFTGKTKNNHYTRVLTTCFNEKGFEYPCWVYVVDKKEFNLSPTDYLIDGIYSRNSGFNEISEYSDSYYEEDLKQGFPELYEDNEEDFDLVELLERANKAKLY